LPQTRVSLSTDPISSDVRGELLPKIRRKSLGFWSSNPSPGLSLRRSE
jgi:hypothetical protein